ncbi:short-chain dehydrogenase/reductase SDR [Halorhabdus utahensis DSM 12940]|uniref:Short-chain dehydrogenase/reductase SDR n=1 Tax=Halorhabdus utahensis (strain DSM 12940 / JCM 11049 / AX-2) TaxID=519442 RepID=C7NSM3_HALUD|nr:SDR family oxidoreductase [Halorhabdus utahensis]ACV13139.1 short-chain dehydrogenase/reductase SDR [Halorhabdus utahensis DSM 12940]
MAISFDFSDHVVLVTGAGGALGSATAEAFLDAGATVCAADVIAPSADGYLLAAEQEGLQTYQADFTDEPAVQALVETILADHGRLDALVCVAGTWQGGNPVDKTGTDTFDVLVDVNLRTAFLATKHALPHLRETGGSIVTVSSKSSLEGGSGDALYRASKAGVRLLTESIAVENEGTVRANAILPDVIDTPANRDMMPDANHDEWVDPADIADVIQFLCSEAAAPVNGGSIPVSGQT